MKIKTQHGRKRTTFLTRLWGLWSAEICDLVGLFILDEINNEFKMLDFEIYDLAANMRKVRGKDKPELAPALQ